MRTLSDSLVAAQKTMKGLLAKVVITTDASTYTYGLDTTNRITSISHAETPYSQTAEIVVKNVPQNLTSLSLEGNIAVVSYGYDTGSTEYSACAPMWVIGQQFYSAPGTLVCSFSLAGMFNLMAEEKAKEDYTPDSSNTDTVKTFLTNVAGALIAPFTGYTPRYIVWDSEDGIIDSFQPKDSLYIRKGESRLDVFKRLLSWTSCVARAEDDSYIHVFVPTTTGTTYNYEYNNTIGASYHTLFNKTLRNRLVIPNKVIVKSHPDHTPQYSGSAIDSASYDLIPIEDAPIYLRLPNDAEANLIATAVLNRYKRASETGSGFFPMNVGQEVLDYIKITDVREDDSKVGNVGYLNRVYVPGQKFEIEVRLGDIEFSRLAGTINPAYIQTEEPETPQDATIKDIISKMNELTVVVNNHEDLINQLMQGTFSKLHAVNQMIIPVK